MIFCCGEALVDMLPRQLESGEDVFLPVSGGAIFNTAITLGRLGAPVGFVSGISNDMFGQQLIDTLAASNVDSSKCIRSDQPTTLAFVKLTDGQASYSFVDENSAGQMVDIAHLPALPAETTALHFGAISLIPEPCGTAYETLMQDYQDKAVISLDPNIRPSFIKDAHKHRARIQRMIGMSDIVKVSDEDLEWISPDATPDKAISAMLEDGGVKIVILTKGSDGITAFTKSDRIDLPAQKVDVVDTIGAGDSFNGGFLDGLNRQNLLSKSALENASPQDIEPALTRAIRVAAVTVSRAGANSPWASEIGNNEQ